MKIIVVGPAKLAAFLERSTGIQSVQCDVASLAANLNGQDPTETVIIFALPTDEKGIINDLADQRWKIVTIGDRPMRGAAFLPLNLPGSTLTASVLSLLDSPPPSLPPPPPPTPPSLPPPTVHIPSVRIPASSLENSPHPPATKIDQPLVVSNPNAQSEGGSTVIAVTARKGGVGKSTVSLLSALWIADHYQSAKRVCIEDANVGQADNRKYLVLDGVPTITSLAMRTETDQSNPDVVGPAMSAVPETALSALAGPRYDEYNASLITPGLYRRVTGALRQLYDVIVVDTPAVGESGGIIEEFVLKEADRILVVLDPNSTSLSNAVEWLEDITAPTSAGGYGFDPDGIFVVLNQAEDKVGISDQDVRIALNRWTFAGIIPRIPDIRREMNVATAPRDILNILHDPRIGPTISSVLSTVLNDESLALDPGKQTRRRRAGFLAARSK